VDVFVEFRSEPANGRAFVPLSLRGPVRRTKIQGMVASLEYPRRQWPLCPRCSSRETIREEIDSTRCCCQSCGYRWRLASPIDKARSDSTDA
jgi:hypothetical protein